jgi:calcineurin-like phosphoesterase family protein
MSKIFVTSDLHFNHDREFIWGPRGFHSIEGMNEAIVQRWNSVVSPEDTVYVLGDLCLGGGEALAKNEELLLRLNGNLQIILGNHDTTPRKIMYASLPNVTLVPVYADMLHYKGYHFYMSHFPTMTSNLEKETLKQCTINLYGHTHQQNNFYQDIPFMYHVGVDSHNCYPVLLDDIIEEMKNKVKECKEQI